MAETLLPSRHADTIQTTCSLIVTFATKLGDSFRPFADNVVVPLLNAGRKIRRRPMEERRENPNLGEWKMVEQMTWQSAETCLDVISAESRYDLTRLLDHYEACHSGTACPWL